LIAIVAKNLKEVRKAVSFYPIEHSIACPDLFPVLCAAAVDVIDCKKTLLAFSATGAPNHAG
jgi:hypothetical protein